MTTLDDLLDQDDAAARARNAGRQAASALAAVLYRLGWLVAKVLWLLLMAVGAVLYGVGWAGRRVVWPALVWCGRAVRLGWQDARRRGD